MGSGTSVAQGQIQAQPSFRAFRGAADHADGRIPPQLLDQPPLGILLARDLVDTHHGKRVMTIDDHLYTLTFFFDAPTGRLG